MGEAEQLVPYANCWNELLIPVENALVPVELDHWTPVEFASWTPVELQPWTPNETSLNNFQVPNFALTFLPQNFLALQSHSLQAETTVTYVRQPADERIVRNTLDSLNQWFACQPGEVIAAFETYLSPPERHADGPWSGQHQQTIVTVSAVSPIPRDRQVCIETEAKDHILHLETMILAKEQEAPAAIEVGQILISGGEIWTRIKRSFSNLFSDCSERVLWFGSISVGLSGEAI
jgi:hypothetical protein